MPFLFAELTRHAGTRRLCVPLRTPKRIMLPSADPTIPSHCRPRLRRIGHSAFPFQPLREVTQLQFSYWPDFGTSQPTHILRLIEQCNKLVRANSSTHFGCHEPEPEGQRPILVHCSAGCGRTGTFCTIDSVIDMLKRVSLTRSKSRPIDHEAEDLFPGDQPLPVWTEDEHVDLVAKTVEDFRTQRPSMVQNLRQFVLCYESILEWVTSGPRRVLLSEEE